MGHVIQCLPLYDLVATYSKSSVKLFVQLNAPKVKWIPLAGDPSLHSPYIKISDFQRQSFDCDVGFIGNYRPERENVIRKLLSAGIDVKVWGHDTWRRDAIDSILLSFAQHL
ncbi:hypothetical protein ES708_29026 [subsurface metagenome]